MAAGDGALPVRGVGRLLLLPGAVATQLEIVRPAQAAVALAKDVPRVAQRASQVWM